MEQARGGVNGLPVVAFSGRRGTKVTLTVNRENTAHSQVFLSLSSWNSGPLLLASRCWAWLLGA